MAHLSPCPWSPSDWEAREEWYTGLWGNWIFKSCAELIRAVISIEHVLMDLWEAVEVGEKWAAASRTCCDCWWLFSACCGWTNWWPSMAACGFQLQHKAVPPLVPPGCRTGRGRTCRGQQAGGALLRPAVSLFGKALWERSAKQKTRPTDCHCTSFSSSVSTRAHFITVGLFFPLGCTQENVSSKLPLLQHPSGSTGLRAGLAQRSPWAMKGFSTWGGELAHTLCTPGGSLCVTVYAATLPHSWHLLSGNPMKDLQTEEA